MNAEKKLKTKETFLKWDSPMRYFKQMDKKKYWVILACVLAFFVILTILGQFWFMAAIAAVLFLVYVIGTVEPVNVHHELTSLGIETMGVEYEWKDLTQFWFSKKDDQLHLNVETKLRFPGQLIMLVKNESITKTNGVLSKYCKYKDNRKQNAIDRIIYGEWIDMLEDTERK